MHTSLQSSSIEFRTDRVERLVVGVLLVFVGSGAVAFWNVEQSVHGPLVAILLIGALFAGLGLFMIGFRRMVRIEHKRGVSERRTLFGVTVAEWRYPLADFDAVGSRVSAADMLSWDVALFRRDGGCLVLRAWVGDAEEVQNEIARVAQCLGLPAEREPRMRTYLIGP